MLSTRRIAAACTLVVLIAVMAFHQEGAVAQKADGQLSNGQKPEKWVDEIEQVFIRSEECKQCHDRHYEEWKGAREQTPDLKTFGRVDAALLHGTSLESPVFRTVLGVWLQTNPTADERKRCLSCHVPATTVFPQYAEKIAAQVMSGKPQIEGIGCASCHLIKESTNGPPPTFKIEPGKIMHGPYADPEENLVHEAVQEPLFRGANYCASCHFDKVKDVTQKDLPGEILQGTI
jgi:nitrate/TMAO reductase-like tetraheme cytochrome c subunit